MALKASPSAYFYTDVHMDTFWLHYNKDNINGENPSQMKALMAKLVRLKKAKFIADPRYLAKFKKG